MAYIISVVSQKGGPGKSTISRLLGTVFAKNKWDVLIADMDISQGTSYHWQSRRLQNNIQPEINVQQFSSIDRVLRQKDSYDLIVIDGAPHATSTTKKSCENSDLVIIPTSLAIDDLQPATVLTKELVQAGINKNKIWLILSKIGTSSSELYEAIEYLENAGTNVFKEHIPEKTGYRRASDIGCSIMETKYSSLNKKSMLVFNEISEKLNSLITGDV